MTLLLPCLFFFFFFWVKIEWCEREDFASLQNSHLHMNTKPPISFEWYFNNIYIYKYITHIFLQREKVRHINFYISKGTQEEAQRLIWEKNWNCRLCHRFQSGPHIKDLGYEFIIHFPSSFPCFWLFFFFNFYFRLPFSASVLPLPESGHAVWFSHFLIVDIWVEFKLTIHGHRFWQAFNV